MSLTAHIEVVIHDARMRTAASDPQSGFVQINFSITDVVSGRLVFVSVLIDTEYGTISVVWVRHFLCSLSNADDLQDIRTRRHVFHHKR